MRTRFSSLRLLIFVLLVICGLDLSPLLAQTYSSLSGVVSDQSGAVIPGASLTLQNVSTGVRRSAVSAADGSYTFALVPPGTYNLRAEKSGFATSSITNIILEVNTNTRHDVTMRLGQVRQQVSVEASPVQVNTQTADLGSIVKAGQMTSLPLNGRDFLQLSLLSPGVAPPPTQNGQSTAQSPVLGGGRQTETVEVSGTREVSEIVMFDGIPEKEFFYGLTALQPPVDSIAEFKIQQGYFSSQFYSPAIINVVTKSGTNRIHGAAWEFLRNDVLNARNYFDINRAPFKQNQFGFNAGGPLIKNKVFWFGDYEGLRLRNYSTQYLTEPSPTELNGDFSALSTPIYDPATYDPATGTRQAFLGNIIPPDRMSNFAKAYLKYIPAPNSAPIATEAGANLAGVVTKPQNDNKWDVRGDVDWSNSDRFFARFSRIVSSVNTNSLNPVADLIAPLTADNAVLGWTHIFSGTVVNDFRVGLDRANLVSGTPANASGSNYAASLGLVNAGGIAMCNGVPGVGMAGYSAQGEGDGNCIINGNTDKIFLDNLSIVHGRHTITTGFNIRRVSWNMTDAYTTVGNFSFTGQYSGNSVADFLLGDPVNVSGGLASQPTYRRAIWPMVYVNDIYHATQKLTVDYGINWVYTPPPGEKYNNLWGFNFNQDAMVRCGTQLNGALMPRGCFARHWFDFSPRLGLAYAPAKGWSLRASYGVFWDRIPGNEWVWSDVGYPYQSSYSAVGDPNIPTISIAGLFPPPPPLGGTPADGTYLFNIGPPNRKDPYIQQWTASIQHTLPGHVFLELAYVGSKGTHLSKRVDANLDLSPPAPGDTRSVQARRPYQPFGFFLSDQARANSEYEAMQFSARKVASRGLSFVTGFTYSKSLDQDSYDGKATRNYMPYSMDKGLSTFNMKYRLSAGVVYALPFGASMHGALRQALYGWQLNGIVTEQSGVPFQVTTIQDWSNTGAFWIPRPNRICDGNLPASQQTQQHWFNTSCFVNPALDTYGNGGVAYLNTDGFSSVDLDLNKDFQVTEHATLQFRAEAFNSFNNVNFDQPGSTLGTPGFGVVGSAEAPRQFQFALKLLF